MPSKHMKVLPEAPAPLDSHGELQLDEELAGLAQRLRRDSQRIAAAARPRRRRRRNWISAAMRALPLAAAALLACLWAAPPAAVSTSTSPPSGSGGPPPQEVSKAAAPAETFLQQVSGPELEGLLDLLEEQQQGGSSIAI